MRVRVHVCVCVCVCVRVCAYLFQERGRPGWSTYWDHRSSPHTAHPEPSGLHCVTHTFTHMTICTHLMAASAQKMDSVYVYKNMGLKAVRPIL